MRFRLILTVDRRSFGDLLPINYQYEQSAVIYRILSKASEEYADCLHHNGFQLESGRRFKLFTFSRLKIEKRQVLPQNERIRILSDSVEWQISSCPKKVPKSLFRASSQIRRLKSETANRPSVLW